ncbi:MAG: hypothetical protein ACKVRP_02410 [Bacteroidota bacterium]
MRSLLDEFALAIAPGVVAKHPQLLEGEVAGKHYERRRVAKQIYAMAAALVDEGKRAATK